MLLCDIGNSAAKFYDGVKIVRVAVDEIAKFQNEYVCYINVNTAIQKRIRSFAKWVDLYGYIELDSAYEGLGADRKMLCSFIADGVIVDAGSAITVDVMEKGRHLGGFIMPGIWRLQEDFSDISPKLDVAFKKDIHLDRIPLNTQEAVSYGILKPVILAIEQFDKKVYVTGGDGEIIASHLQGAQYDEVLMFKAMENLIQRKGIC